jgi:hypothetical protein
MKRDKWRIVFGPLLVIGTIAAVAQDGADQGPFIDFLVGDYAMIGREPNGGAAYAGSARIERSEREPRGVVLQRRRGDRQVEAIGRLEVASPPGDKRVLRFYWRDPDPIVMTCLIGTDLDNYARLTCLWLPEGSHPAEPGLEAMFPTAVWQR